MAESKRSKGGRNKGSPNRLCKIERHLLILYCEETGANPFAYWADILNGTLDQTFVDAVAATGVTKKEAARLVTEEMGRMRSEAARNLAPYLMPRLKQVEVSVTQTEAQRKLAALLGLS